MWRQTAAKKQTTTTNTNKTPIAAIQSQQLGSHIASCERKELIVHISLHLLSRVDVRRCLVPEVGQGADEAIELMVGVVVRPERFTIMRVVAATERLFCPVVYDGDTLRYGWVGRGGGGA